MPHAATDSVSESLMPACGTSGFVVFFTNLFDQYKHPPLSYARQECCCPEINKGAVN